MKSKKFFSGFMVLLAIAMAQPCISETVKIVSFPYYPIGKPDSTGTNPDIVTAAFKAVGDKALFDFYPRKRALILFSQNKDLLFMGEARYFPDILEQLDAQKFINYQIVLLYKKDRFPSLKFNSIEDLKGHVLGASLGSSLTATYREAGWKVEEVSELEYNLYKLMSDRIDFWGTVDITGVTLIRELFPNQAKNIGSVEIEEFPIELVVKKNSASQATLNRFRLGMTRIIENGTYANILKKYFGDNIPAATPVHIRDIPIHDGQ